MSARDGYGDLEHIREEMRWVRAFFRAHPEWTVLDITRKAIEETASLLLEHYRQRFENGARAEPVPAEGA